MSITQIHTNNVDEAFAVSALSFMPGTTKAYKGGYTLAGDAEMRGFNIRTVSDSSSPDQGKPMLEQSVLLEIDDPIDRLIYSKSIDIFNLVGLWVYLLRGGSDLRDIEFYNPMARKFVDEEVSIASLRANWGERLFGSGGVSKLVELLKTSPHSRRAVLPVFTIEDLGYPSRNLPCLTSVQFVRFSRKLNMYVTMRSQAAIGVLPYDLFLLTMLHEYVAGRTGSELGTYHHFAPVFGVRENELQVIHDIATQSQEQKYTGRSMSKMPVLEPGLRSFFLDTERRIRQGNIIWDASAVGILPPYWRSLLAVSYTRRLFLAKDPNWEKPLHEAKEAFPEEFIEKCCVRIRAQFLGTVSGAVLGEHK